MLTESYSALKAEVPFDGDRSTDLNEDLLRRLLAATQVIFQHTILQFFVS